jgi:hypothetical protein
MLYGSSPTWHETLPFLPFSNTELFTYQDTKVYQLSLTFQKGEHWRTNFKIKYAFLMPIRDMKLWKQNLIVCLKNDEIYICKLSTSGNITNTAQVSFLENPLKNIETFTVEGDYIYFVTRGDKFAKSLYVTQYRLGRCLVNPTVRKFTPTCLSCEQSVAIYLHHSDRMIFHLSQDRRDCLCMTSFQDSKEIRYRRCHLKKNLNYISYIRQLESELDECQSFQHGSSRPRLTTSFLFFSAQRGYIILICNHSHELFIMSKNMEVVAKVPLNPADYLKGAWFRNEDDTLCVLTSSLFSNDVLHEYSLCFL